MSVRLSLASCGGGGGGGDSVLAAPTGVAATPGHGQVIIAWTPLVGATSYNMYWSTAPGVTVSTGTKITDAANPYTQTGLANGTAYYYVVTAVNFHGESGASTEASGAPSHPVVLDAIFGTDGIAITSIGAHGCKAYEIAIQEDGKIVVGGTFAVSKDETFIVLARNTSDGSLDTSVDSDGMVMGPAGYFAGDIALQPDGKIVLGGYAAPGTDFFLMRYE